VAISVCVISRDDIAVVEGQILVGSTADTKKRAPLEGEGLEALEEKRNVRLLPSVAPILSQGALSTDELCR